MKQDISVFLRNANGDKEGYSEEKIERAKLASEGVNPCENCPYRTSPEGCVTLTCLPWYKYFQYRWRRLRRGMLGK